MLLALYRQRESAISTQGELFRDGSHQCWTLERSGPEYPSDYHRIPAGAYQITLYQSPHFGRLMPLLQGLGEPIEIHWGNVPGASHGCILVGRVKGEDTIFFTRDAFDDLFPFIQAACQAEGCSITVYDPPADAAATPLHPDLATQI